MSTHDRSAELTRRDCDLSFRDHVTRLARLKGTTVFVTGGTGFIGTWLAEGIAYLNDQHSFGTQLVLLSRGTDAFKVLRPHLARRDDISFVKSDIRHLLELPRQTSWIVHAAGNPDSRFHSTSPTEAMSVIADGTHSVLRAADRCENLKMLLNMSSALIYGAQPLELERLPESYVGAVPTGSVSSAYAEAKRYSETVCAAARSQARIPTMSVRPFAFLGPYQSLDTPWAMNSFIRDALNGNPINVMSDGRTVRSYLYGSDMASWTLNALVNGSEADTYNLGSPDAIQLESLARKIASHFNPQPEIRLHGSLTVPQSRLVPDVSLAQRKLGVKQEISLDSAITRTVEWHRSRNLT
jgi:nucleoside-diphosphate-sugar epimerase